VTDDTPKSTKEQLKELPLMIKKKANSVFRKKMLYKRVPILNWLPKYSSQDAVGDVIAGVTVGECTTHKHPIKS
jgi:sodium-independent sulfate anion transporter 11